MISLIKEFKPIDRAHRIGELRASADWAIIARFTSHATVEGALVNLQILKRSVVVAV